MKKIGIIGNGFVGSTLYKVLSQMWQFDVKVYDKDPEKSLNSLEETCESDVLFVAVPTPMILETGECYLGIVDIAISQCRDLTDVPIVIKSTVPPGSTDKFNEKYGSIFFNPEFLTEANAYHDFVDLEYQIIGFPEGDEGAQGVAVKIGEIFQKTFKQNITRNADLHVVKAKTAEFTKYVRNCYLATRISFFNEIKQIGDRLDVPYDALKELVGLDNRIGDFYNRIDEDEPEYSGSCLPKDINALIVIAKSLEVDPKVLQAGWDKNTEVSKKNTWTSMPGRAFVNEEQESE